MRISDILSNAKTRIEDPNNWTGSGSLGKGGTNCALTATRDDFLYDPDYEVGSIRTEAADYLDLAAQQLKHCNIIYLNNNYGHEMVMKAYDLAIALAKAYEQKVYQ